MPQTTELPTFKAILNHCRISISSRTVGHTCTALSVVHTSRPKTKFGLNFRPVDVQVGSALFVSIKSLFVAACQGSKGTGVRQTDSPALEMKARPHTARAPQGSRAFQRGSEALPMVGPPWPMRFMVVAGHCLHALIARFGWVPFFCSKWVPFFCNIVYAQSYGFFTTSRDLRKFLCRCPVITSGQQHNAKRQRCTDLITKKKRKSRRR